jgi:hypothetical protein
MPWGLTAEGGQGTAALTSAQFPQALPVAAHFSLKLAWAAHQGE